MKSVIDGNLRGNMCNDVMIYMYYLHMYGFNKIHFCICILIYANRHTHTNLTYIVLTGMTIYTVVSEPAQINPHTESHAVYLPGN